ncbi:MAG: hypothetical protein U0936_18385 [Planctomycetaceae bacterium]
MTTRELYKAIGVAGYEPLGCWRKEGIFHLRLQAPAALYRCPSVEIATSFGEVKWIASFMPGRIGMDRTVLASSKLPVLNVVSASVC